MRSRVGAALLVAAGVLGLFISLVNYFERSSGINHSGGALVVTISTGLLYLLSLALISISRVVSGLRRVIAAFVAADVIGTSVAAYFLHAWWLLGFMGVALVGWLLLTFGVTSRAGGEGTQPARRDGIASDV